MGVSNVSVSNHQYISRSHQSTASSMQKNHSRTSQASLGRLACHCQPSELARGKAKGSLQAGGISDSQEPFTAGLSPSHHVHASLESNPDDLLRLCFRRNSSLMSTQTYHVAVPNVMSSPTKEMSCIFLTLLQKAAGYCSTIASSSPNPSAKSFSHSQPWSESHNHVNSRDKSTRLAGPWVKTML